jgi:hypothetical protein
MMIDTGLSYGIANIIMLIFISAVSIYSVNVAFNTMLHAKARRLYRCVLLLTGSHFSSFKATFALLSTSYKGLLLHNDAGFMI